MPIQQQYGNNLIAPYGQQDYSSFFYGKNNFAQNSTPTNNLIWVQGIEGAKALMLSPNSKVVCLDSEIENRLYIKTADELGVTKLRKFNLSEIQEEETKQQNLSEYVRKDELQDLILGLLPTKTEEKEVVIDEPAVSTTQPTTIIRRTTTPAAK